MQEDSRFTELLSLLEALCEERLSDEEARRLEQFVLEDDEARQVYLSYIDLHGSLHWDVASHESDETAIRETVKSEVERVLHRERRMRRQISVGLAVSICLLLVTGFMLASGYFQAGDTQPDVAKSESSDTNSSVNVPVKSDANVVSSKELARNTKPRRHNNLKLKGIKPKSDVTNEKRDSDEAVVVHEETDDSAPGSIQSIIGFINAQIRNGWELNGVEPSEVAEDSEWIRRVYLDIVGHIPPVDAVERFLADARRDKRARVVDELLDDPDYVRNWTTIWTNLLIGRSDQQGVDRRALQKFLRESFAKNRPWNEIVTDLVAAEGRSDENGATNFLLAHLNNQATPATAITARLFMGVQVQCTQCHSHPHNNFKQDQFWELNSFFKQTARVNHQRRNEQTGAMQFSHAELTSNSVGGATFYENRQGVMKAAYPRFENVKVDPGETVNRRTELAQLMTSGEKPLIADAIVNRMWRHFCGFGFTRVVDDLGPHNPPTHPALFERLSREFVKSNYDLKQLVRVICNSELYGLSSRFNSTNGDDDPVSGTDPLFSRMYVKSMTVEQLYDSIIVATRAHYTAGSDWSAAERMRREWLQQFVTAYETDENDESTNFDGTITQALMMMNGELVQRALGDSHDTFLDEVVGQKGTEIEKIRKLCLSALARYPNSRELTAVRKLLRERVTGRAGNSSVELARLEGLQDVFWAYLNSNEFILIY